MAPFCPGKAEILSGTDALGKGGESIQAERTLLRDDGLDRNELLVESTRRVVATTRGM